jgi:DNA-binding transcriptional LysR family regulator
MPGMDTSLDQWEAFRAVIQCGGFAQAAAHLNRSQSAISYAIARLQDKIGARVFELVGRRARLTESGRALLADAEPLLSGFRSLEERARALASGGESQICLAVDSIYPNERLFSALAKLTKLYPHVRLTLLQDTLLSSADVFAKHGAHLCITNVMPDEHFSWPIMDVRLLAVAGADHPLRRKGRRLTRADLIQHCAVVIEGTEGPLRHEQPRPLSQLHLHVNTIEAAIDAVRSGLCFGWLPIYRIRPYLSSGELVPLRLPVGTERIVHLWLVHADAESLGPERRTLADLLGASRGLEVI